MWTLDVTDITATSAKAHGEVTDEGASPVTERGICWSATNPIPTIDDEHGDNGTGLGTYEVNLTNLTPGTTYYVRAYAKNNQSDEPVYGTSESFKTEATCPTVETVGIDGTTVSGNVTDDGGASITERGVCWSTNDDPTLHYAPYPTAGTGPYSVELTDLEPGKTYKVKAYARNSVCPAYGEELTLTMEADPPTVQTLEVSNLGQNSAMGNANVTNDGGAAITERGVCWSTSPMPDLNDSHAVSEETPDIGTFTAMMNELIPNTHYYVRAYAKNSAGKIGYGNDKDFTTLQSVSAPTVITLEVTSPTQTTATGNGNVTDDGGSPITERGVCWGTNHNPDLNGSYNSCTTNGTGTYQVSMTGLTPGTTYYVRAYARNEAGLSYAENEVSFSTGAQQYTITVSASTGGSAHVGSTTGPNTGTFTQGQSCTVYAVANSNYTFTNWTEGGTVVSTQANYPFTVNSNRTLVANFQQQTTDQTFTVNGVSFTMKRVEGGTFWMGAQSTDPSGQNYDSEASDNESPVHSVTLSTFYMGETEVTQELWQAVMGSNPSHFSGTNLPVEGVSWNTIVNEFLPALNAATGQNFRLPTEAEWEYAARGGNQGHGYKYAGSNTIGNVAWYYDNSNNQTHSVATKSPNELGLYDMSGNVWEWCSDWYGNYSSGSQTNPQGPSSGSDRVSHGGSWHYGAWMGRVSHRGYAFPGYAFPGGGFRLCLPQ